MLSICELTLNTGFTVTKELILAASICTHMRFCVHVGKYTPLTVSVTPVSLELTTV